MGFVPFGQFYNIPEAELEEMHKTARRVHTHTPAEVHRMTDLYHDAFNVVYDVKFSQQL